MSTTTRDRIAGLTAGLAMKAPVRVASTANLVLEGVQTVDGVALAEDDRALVKDQDNAIENGIYDVASGSWTRSLDFDGTRDVVSGTFVVAAEGTAGEGLLWRLSTANPITIDATALTFTLMAISPASAFILNLLDDANAAAARTTIGAATNPVPISQMASGTRGEIIYYGASGVPAALPVGTSGKVLMTKGAAADPVWATGVPIGAGMEWYTATAPSLWLIQNGAAVSRATYAALFAVIGITYGPGDGSTTFNLPDRKGRIGIGAGLGDAAGATTWALGQKPVTGAGGEEGHVQVEAELATHLHDDGTLAAASGGAHPHSITPSLWPENGTGAGHPTAGASGNSSLDPYAAQSAGAHGHDVTGETGTVGDSDPMNIMPPVIGVNFIIYAGV